MFRFGKHISKANLAVLLTGLVLTMIFTCSPKTNYKVLSKIFDGVPNPSATDSLSKKNLPSSPKTQSAPTNDISATKTQRTVHPVYQDGDCSICHDPEQGNVLISKQPDLCYDCHSNYGEEYEVLHGPVAAGFCIVCHQPHTAAEPKLLAWKKSGFCLNCHAEEDVYKTEVHEGIEKDQCMDCHNPHGGGDRFLFWSSKK